MVTLIQKILDKIKIWDGTNTVDVIDDGGTYRLAVDSNLTVSDIQIGAVEIKDGDSGTRLDVELDSTKNAAFIQSETLAQDLTLTDRSQKTHLTDGTVDVTVTTNGSREELDVNATISDISLRPGRFVTRFALNGASNDLNVDGSSTPVVFEILPGTDKKFVIRSFVVTMIDTAIKFSKFAGLNELTNGLKIEFKEGGEPVRETAESPFKVNSQFYEGGFLTNLQSEETDIFVATINLFTQSGTSLELLHSRGDFIRITVQDDLQSIDSLKILAHGYEVDE